MNTCRPVYDTICFFAVNRPFIKLSGLSFSLKSRYIIIKVQELFRIIRFHKLSWRRDHVAFFIISPKIKIIIFTGDHTYTSAAVFTAVISAGVILPVRSLVEQCCDQRLFSFIINGYCHICCRAPAGMTGNTDP